METGFMINKSFIDAQNQIKFDDLNSDFECLKKQLGRKGIAIDEILEKAKSLRVALPSWAVGTGGTRFARYPGNGEPRNIDDKLSDCATINNLLRFTPNVSLHIPWDKVEDNDVLLKDMKSLGLGVDIINSNTFQDQDDLEFSYKFGSLTHTDSRVRKQAIDHNIECIEIGKKLGSKGLTVWIGDGGNFPGQQHTRNTLDRYLDSLKEIYKHLPDDWRIYIEHKFFEPAFYSTVMNDWGINYYCVKELGEKAFSLVDLGHHPPNTNIEMIVARLIQFGKLGGFHFNDSKYGDDDLDTGSLKPFQLFLIFNELVDAELNNLPDFNPAYMLDQSHNVTDPIESLFTSAIEVRRAYVQALLVDRDALSEYQENNDPLMALQTLKAAYNTDVSPILAMARYQSGGAIDPLNTYRESGYRAEKTKERPKVSGAGGGIV